jgi:hypothetical protein
MAFPIVAALIISAIVGAGTSIYSGNKQNEAIEDARKESAFWANRQRQDKLNVDAANEKINKWNMKMREKEFAWQKSEDKKGRKERGEEWGYQRRENQWGKLLGIANQNKQIKDSLLAYFPKTQPVGA